MQVIKVETGATITTQIRSKEIFLETSTMEVIPQTRNITIPIRRSEMAMLESTM